MAARKVVRAEWLRAERLRRYPRYMLGTPPSSRVKAWRHGSILARRALMAL